MLRADGLVDDDIAWAKSDNWPRTIPFLSHYSVPAIVVPDASGTGHIIFSLHCLDLLPL